MIVAHFVLISQIIRAKILSCCMEEKPFSPLTEHTCDGAFFVCTVPVPPTKKAPKLNVLDILKANLKEISDK